MKNKINIIIFLLLTIMILSCNNSKKYCKIDSKSIKENETEILNLAYESFFNSNSYINSQKMNPPMIFDQIYTRILNYDSNIKADDKLIREFKIDFEDLPIDVKELKSMFSNNIPIVEVADRPGASLQPWPTSCRNRIGTLAPTLRSARDSRLS